MTSSVTSFIFHYSLIFLIAVHNAYQKLFLFTLLLQNDTTKCKERYQFFMNLTWKWKRANNGICAMFSYESEWRGSSRPVSLKLYCYCIQTGVVFWSHGLSVFVCFFFYSLSIFLFHFCPKSLSLLFLYLQIHWF